DHGAAGTDDVRVVACVLSRDAEVRGAALGGEDAGDGRRTSDVGLHARVVALEGGDADAGVAVVVRVVRNGVRDGLADIRRGSGLLRLRLEGEVRRNGDRKQDADDDQNDQELDERETALVPGETLPNAEHAVFFLSGWV